LPAETPDADALEIRDDGISRQGMLVCLPGITNLKGMNNMTEIKDLIKNDTAGMNRINIQYYKTSIGEMILGSFNRQLCIMDFRYRRMRSTIDRRIKKGLEAEFTEQDDEVLREARKQLDEYLKGKRTAFDIPILMVGTDFQKEVWKALMQVPYGRTATYSELAESINAKESVRAVAGANGANAIAIIIPCHRIIGSDGDLIGYGGGIAVKKRLLNMERRNR